MNGSRAAVLTGEHGWGCKFARADHGGHTDAARRLSDVYNLHKAAGSPVGWIFSVALSDGSGGDELFATKAEAVDYYFPWEDWRAYLKLGPQSMDVCEAESVMAWQRQTSALGTTGRDYRRGGLEVIPRLNVEDMARQYAALRGELAMPLALGYLEDARQ